MTQISLPSALKSRAHPLDNWGVIDITGADAVKFIHAQLTQDFALLGSGHFRLAALCTPQGRMLASFWGIKVSPERILLLTLREQIPEVVKRLSMFVLRAAVRLHDASTQWVVAGQLDEAAGPSTAQDYSHTGERFTLSHVGQERQEDSTYILHLPPVLGIQRQLRLSPASGEAPGKTDSVPAAAPTEWLTWWDWLDVMSGIAMVNQSSKGQWVPQMLNYESVGGISFKKGCYPGQEVVARSQFRGILKRRSYLLQSPVPTPCGALIHVGDEEAGQVVATAAHPIQGFTALAVLNSALSGSDLPLVYDGHTLTPLTMPYKIIEDI